MASALSPQLTLAESGALALADAAADLDGADDAEKFLLALERNRRVWRVVRDLAAREGWQEPSLETAESALKAARKAGRRGCDDAVARLVDLNLQVSAELAHGDDIGHIRQRAYFNWESRGRPHGRDLEHWLLAEMELAGR